MKWEDHLSTRTRLMRRSSVREFLKYADKPGIISFAGGLPDPELLPVDEIRVATDRVLRRHGARALQYGPTEGVQDLRACIAERFRDVGATPDNVLITSGSQQALDLIGRVLLDEGHRVAVQNPTYLAALSAWRPYGVRFQGGTGIWPLGSSADPSPNLIYCMPNFQNPTGLSLGPPERHRLIDYVLARDVPLVEDDAYGQLRYDGEFEPSLLSMSSSVAGPVIHTGTFSKIVAPGLRIGWIAASAELIERLARAKQAMDLHSNTLAQYTLFELLQDGTIERIIPRLRSAYRQKRDLMLSELERAMPNSVRWTYPRGGLFLLLNLPNGVDGSLFAQNALDRGVAIVPGGDFHVHGGFGTVRLNFSYPTAEGIRAGVQRLAGLMRDHSGSDAFSEAIEQTEMGA